VGLHVWDDVSTKQQESLGKIILQILAQLGMYSLERKCMPQKEVAEHYLTSNFLADTNLPNRNTLWQVGRMLAGLLEISPTTTKMHLQNHYSWKRILKKYLHALENENAATSQLSICLLWGILIQTTITKPHMQAIPCFHLHSARV
jgi:hypothetical protein